MADSKPTGTVVALQRRPAKGAATELSEQLELDTTAGIVGDHGGNKNRHVTLLAEECWSAAIGEIGRDLPWGARRANVLLRDVDLRDSEGRRLAIGDSVIEIDGETHPCQLMEDTAAGLLQALVPQWRGGAHGRVINAGTIRPGDPARWLNP